MAKRADERGRVVIVTGGSRGIGARSRFGLGARGYRVVVVARSEGEAPAGAPFARYASGTIHDTARLIAERGGTAIGVRCYLTRADEIHALVETTLDRFGRIDALVHNAGVDCELPVPTSTSTCWTGASPPTSGRRRSSSASLHCGRAVPHVRQRHRAAAPVSRHPGDRVQRADQTQDRTALTRAMRRRGLGTFTIRPAGDRAEYHAIIYYLEPLDRRNEKAWEHRWEHRRHKGRA